MMLVTVICAMLLEGGMADSRPSGLAGVTDDTILIQDAWEAREAEVNTARFEWKEQRTYMAGTMLPNPRGTRTPRKLPPEDLTVTVTAGISIDGSMLRYYTDGPQWNLQYERFLPEYNLAVFDGTTSITFFEGSPDGEHPHPSLGFVNDVRRNLQSDSPHLDAALAAFRPVNPDLRRISLHSSAVHPDILYGITHYRITGQNAATGVETTVWVDPERNFVVSRLSRAVGGDLVFVLDIEYIDDPDGGWIPSQWRGVTLHPSGEVLMQFVATMVTYELNPRIPLAEFQFSFPEGTEVADRVDNVHYLVGEGGTRRVLSTNELRRRQGWEDLGTIPPATMMDGTVIGMRWVLAVAGTIGVVFILMVLMIGRVVRHHKYGR